MQPRQINQADQFRVKKIFTKRIAYELMNQGHNLIGMETNRKKEWLKVFIFEETPQLLSDLESLSQCKR
ncbi:hypothetical protein GGQ84_001883 [Desulfitispora alkaliphila]|uniref:hypothetical protein n=1 Tax=Desulfitispora alkaliphila TaxID=622674 RepID=UPI003D2380CC